MVIVPPTVITSNDEDFPYQIIGEIGVNFKGRSVEPRRQCLIGSIKEYFGGRLVVEPYSVHDYLSRMERVLTELGITEVLQLRIDGKTVAEYDEEKKTDLRSVVKETFYKEPGKRHAFIHVSGYTPMFNVEIEAEYERKHGINEPSLNITVTGVPKTLLKGEHETGEQYEQRMEDILDDDDTYGRSTSEAEGLMRQELEELFVPRIKYTFHTESIEVSVETVE